MKPIEPQYKTPYAIPHTPTEIQNKIKKNQIYTSRISKVENSNTSLQTIKSRSIKSGIISFFREKIMRVSSSKVSSLIGATIEPNTAYKLRKKISFDGTGKIIALKQKNIKSNDYNVLIENRIKPLNETPQIAENRIRTPGEALIDIASLIRTTDTPSIKKVELESIIKSTWLDGMISRQSLCNIVELIKIKTNNNPTITKKIENIMNSLEKDFFVTKRNDNFYGRHFETELSKHIINNPSKDMMKVRDSISSFIIEHFSSSPHDEQKRICASIAKLMREDPPTWRHNLSLANKFIKNETPACFIEMMKFSGEHSVPLVLSVAVKYIISAKAMIGIKNQATQYYVNKILPQRLLIKSFNTNANSKTDAYGLRLPYQKVSSSNNEVISGSGVRPMDRYVRPTDGADLTEHDAIALNSERAIGIGMSGSANILNFLFIKLQSQNEHFPMDDAKLATASWLSYSGGHSFNEAYSSFGFMHSGNFKPLSFNTLKTSSTLSNNAISFAYDKVIEASIELRG